MNDGKGFKMRDTDIEKIREIAGVENVSTDEIMAPHMSMKVGGPADCFVKPAEAAVGPLVKYLNEEGIPYYVIGNGSNVIIRDEGYRGVIICVKEGLWEVSIDGTTVRAGAGVSLKDLADIVCSASLTGFEFASGIPGSLGGAVTMNAGAYDGEMKNVVTCVEAVDKAGNAVTFTCGEADFSYRHSAFSGGDYIITGAVIELAKGNRDEIQARMDDLNRRRAEKQPLEYPSCGSTFKRPEGFFAGKLIMDAGLAGARAGGASVSAKHCGFVVNDRGGTASDVLAVISMVREKVKEEFGIDLECEVKVL